MLLNSAFISATAIAFAALAIASPLQTRRVVPTKASIPSEDQFAAGSAVTPRPVNKRFGIEGIFDDFPGGLSAFLCEVDGDCSNTASATPAKERRAWPTADVDIDIVKTRVQGTIPTQRFKRQQPVSSSVPSAGSMLLCRDPNTCETLSIPSQAFVGTVTVDEAALCNSLNGCPSSAKVLTPNVVCVWGSQVGLNSQCTGTTQEFDLQSSVADFIPGLADNLNCLTCAANLLTALGTDQ